MPAVACAKVVVKCIKRHVDIFKGLSGKVYMGVRIFHVGKTAEDFSSVSKAVFVKSDFAKVVF